MQDKKKLTPEFFKAGLVKKNYSIYDFISLFDSNNSFKMFSIFSHDMY